MKNTKRTEKPTMPHRLVVQATFKVDHTMPVVLAELSLYDPLLERIQTLHAGLKLLKAFSIRDRVTADQVIWHCDDEDECDNDMHSILTVAGNTIFVESELSTGPESFPIPLTSSSSSAFSGCRFRGKGEDSFCKTATSRRENVPC